jgi:hypothetical protein
VGNLSAGNDEFLKKNPGTILVLSFPGFAGKDQPVINTIRTLFFVERLS